MQPASHVAPTRVRYFTLCLCIAMAVLLYLDRYALSSVTGTLLVELNVNKEQLGSSGSFSRSSQRMPCFKSPPVG